LPMWMVTKLKLQMKNKSDAPQSSLLLVTVLSVPWKNFLFVILLAIPWLNPFSRMPSPPMIPWLVSLACVGLALWATPVELRLNSVSRKVLAFFGLNALYLALHMLRLNSLPAALAGLVAWSSVLAMAYVSASLLIANQAAIRALAAMWLVVALISVVMALLQYLRMEYWFDPWISQSGIGVAFANLRQRNLFASLCGIGLLALLYVRQSDKNYGERLDNPITSKYQLNLAATSWNSVWPWLAVVALAIGNGLSASRTGALQWLLITAMVICWRKSLRSDVRTLGYGALAIYVLVELLMPWFADAVGNINAGIWGRMQEGVSNASRLWMYSNVLDLIAQKPLLGWGWQELSYAQYASHFDKRYAEFLDNAHNLPLHLAVELGTPYAILFCITVAIWVIRAKPWQEKNATRQLAWGVLMLLAVHSLLEYPLWYGPFLMTLGLCVGLLETRLVEHGLTQSQSELAQAVNIFLIGFFLIITVYVTYDYHRVSQIFLGQESRSSMFRNNTWSYAKKSWLFQRKARFAELVNTPVTAQTAPHVLELASDLVHYSPEPRVIQALIESAALLRKDDIVLFHIERYKEVYPKEYANWMTPK
jgi:Virulence factor membrane-bound polymerase, C-terminal/O-Antigen ligase/Protein glycosylation ligase